MIDESPTPLEERILLLAPTKRDAATAVTVFKAVGINLTTCGDLQEICCEIERGAAVAILPDEAIFADEEGRLARLLREQPSWSDFPLIVLVPPHQTKAAARELQLVGHMTLVRRPIEIQSMASTIQAALRDRKRQYARREEFAERERQAEALRRNDRQKDEFLAMLAHELRNPLAAVKGAVAVLKASHEVEGRTWASDVVERQVKQLVRLIDDLLDVSRINSGKIRLRKDFIDARTILDQAVESARPLIDERRHSLYTAIDEEPLPLYADATRVEQIIVNLLTNAAKYTANGGRIWLTAKRDANHVAISVKDNGSGIPPEKLPEMFTLFTQGDRSLARSEGGLGIGLTVVQKLAELHDGSVVARSDGHDKGSEFTVRLPLSSERRPEPPQVETPTEHDGKKGYRILVVDDNADTAHAMVRLLKLFGNEVLAAHDGQTAIAVARTFQPEIVLLDIGLPGMDGYQVASSLRDEALDKEAVIIAVSGYGKDEDRRRSLAAGFDHHLVKPVDFDSLISLIRQPT